jgi:RsiW-degrading membrane proteinase PrsW (M82 family)
MRLFLLRLRRDRSLQQIVFPIVAIIALSFLIGLGVSLALTRAGTLVDQAGRLSSMGRYLEAESIYWKALESGPVELPTLIAFVDNRAALGQAVMFAAMSGRTTESDTEISPQDFARLLDRAGLAREVATLARYWAAVQLGWGSAEDEAVRALADRERPVRHANHLLARNALENHDLPEAARRFEKEGLAFADAREDLSHAVSIWIRFEAWDELRTRIEDPRFAGAIGPSARRALAESQKDWAAYLLWLWPASFAGARAWPIALAVVAGSLWFAIAASLGGVAVRPRRLWLLGVISIYPTLLLITVEEKFFNLQFTGEPLADAIYFVFGVGLREELCKFLLFLPLLPLLRKRGSRLEALICGAMVGLGFAAEENINYFHRMDVSTALGRFLTANFLHMALTGLIGLAAYDSDRPRRHDSLDLNTTLFVAILIHGAYDFLLASPAVGEYSIFAMTVFVLLSQRFLREVLSSNATPAEGSLRLFIISITVLTGASYVYASTLVGPWSAFEMIAVGVVGQAILIYMFVMELGGAR